MSSLISNYENSATEGEARIQWVSQYSPVLNTFVRDIVSDGSLKGKKIAVVVHLEAKTAFLASVLADAGADIVVAGSNPRSTQQSVVNALRERGLNVVSDAHGHMKTEDYMEIWEQELLKAADFEPDYIVDDGAELTLRMHLHRPELYKKLKGVTEQTTTGTARLFALQESGNLPFPALTANNARCKHMFDNRYGTGQTTMQAILKLTNRQCAGAVIVIVGYGYVGRGIAEYAKRMGGQVRIVETDPVRALEAHMDGHTVCKGPDAVIGANFVITATGGIRAVGAPEFATLSHDAVLANAGHHDLEIDVETLANMADGYYESCPNVTTYTVGNKDIHVLSGGALVNIAGGNGHPVEIMDLSFAVQGLGVHYLATQDLQSGVSILPKSLDDAIAESKLNSMGIFIDTPRDEQADDFQSLIKGGQ